MPHAITCTLASPDALPTLAALRLRHLNYIRAHAAEILFGGPTRGPGGVPQEMIIVLRTDDPAKADSCIADEPYRASGRVFADVKVLPWSQVLPEATPGALDSAIEAERRRAESPPRT